MTPWVQRLLIANVGMFFLQLVQPQITSQLAFYPRLDLVIHYPWTMFTYMFLHGGMWHLFFNMYALYLFGSRVETRLGSAHFLNLYLISGLSGAILSVILLTHASIVGASGAIFGVSLAYAMFWPTQLMMIWGVVPVQMRWMVAFYTVYSIFSGMSGFDAGTAHFAHLGGYIGGFIYLRILGAKSERSIKDFRKRAAGAVSSDRLTNWQKVDTKSVHSLNRDEVNRILDKISAHGLSSLTPQERLFLSNFVPPDDRVPPVS